MMNLESLLGVLSKATTPRINGAAIILQNLKWKNKNKKKRNFKWGIYRGMRVNKTVSLTPSWIAGSILTKYFSLVIVWDPETNSLLAKASLFLSSKPDLAYKKHVLVLGFRSSGYTSPSVVFRASVSCKLKCFEKSRRGWKFFCLFYFKQFSSALVRSSNVKTVLFQTIQFSINTQFKCKNQYSERSTV